MQTITFEASETLIDQLEHIAEKLERSRGYLIREALEGYVADMKAEEEDALISMKRLSEDNRAQHISLEQLEKKYGLED